MSRACRSRDRGLKKPKLAQDLLRELFDYRADGQLIWKVQRSSRGVLGTVAGSVGSVNRDGYRIIRINKMPYYAHRLVWVWHYGAEPHGELDHINRDPADNRIENLRDVTASQNQWNRKHTGGVRIGYDGQWRASIGMNGRRIHLGSAFATKEDAEQAVADAKKLRDRGIIPLSIKESHHRDVSGI